MHNYDLAAHTTYVCICYLLNMGSVLMSSSNNDLEKHFLAILFDHKVFASRLQREAHQKKYFFLISFYISVRYFNSDRLTNTLDLDHFNCLKIQVK